MTGTASSSNRAVLGKGGEGKTAIPAALAFLFWISAAAAASSAAADTMAAWCSEKSCLCACSCSLRAATGRAPMSPASVHPSHQVLKSGKRVLQFAHNVLNPVLSLSHQTGSSRGRMSRSRAR